MSAGLYDGPIVDAHHHLWDLSMGRHPWLAPAAGHALGDLSAIRRDYRVEDYLRDSARQNVVASIHVEAGWDPADPVGETRWLETLDKADGVACRYVAHAALADPGVEAMLEAQAACPRVVGIRDILSWHPDPARSFVVRRDLMDDPAWRRGLGLLARHGLVFDLMISPWQLDDARRLAARFPDQLFVLNHCGSPMDRAPEGMARWRTGLRRLAEAPNVSIKVSDLVAYDPDWTLDSLRAVTLHCLDCFGPARAMFASDYPVAGLHATFDEVFDSFKVIVRDLAPAEQRALFHDNARRVYRL